MTVRRFTDKSERSAALRVGLFGNLGSGNIGNNAALEAMLKYLRADHPDAILDAMCGGPEVLRTEYGIDAIPLVWYQKYEQQASGVTAIALKAVGKAADAFRTASWVGRHDVVIVPGGGVLETSLPMRPWGFPYKMFLLCASGKLFGTKVALVSVGANIIGQRLTRWLSTSAARLACYRSYRDTMSRDAMRQRGVDTSQDHVYPDLVSGILAPPYDPGDMQTVGVGVMDYYGTNDERRQADELHASYLEKMKFFVRWLLDSGRRIRLLIGDTNGSDDSVVQEILVDLRIHRPDIDPTLVIAERISSFADMMRAMAPVGTVVATRYHNLICALNLAKPIISIGYSPKNTALMAEMGLSEFSQPANSLDVGSLIEQFKELESRSSELRQTIIERNAANARLLDQQFARLSAVLFPAVESARTAAEHRPARRGTR